MRRPRGRALALAVTLAVAVSGGLAAQADAFVYWTNGFSRTIGRANLDGTGANQSFITGADNRYGVAVDGQHVYWAQLPLWGYPALAGPPKRSATNPDTT